MLQKFYSIFSHKNKGKCLQINQKNQALQKHWEDVMLGRKKLFLPLPDEAKFEISIGEIAGLQQELNEIHKRLSILEGRKLDKFDP